MAWKNSTEAIVSRDMSTRTLEVFNPLIKTEHLRIFQLICYGVVSQFFVVFGMVTNVINMVCFVKQGFKEPINISLFGLAISDFGSLLTIGWTNICLIPAFQEKDLDFDPLDTHYFITGMPHIVLTRVTSCITAFITLERCLCITMPLKVARIFTPRRVSVIIVSIFVSLSISISPIYYVGGYGMKYFPERNKTVIGLVFSNQREIVEQVSFAINSVFVPFSALSIMLVCMIVTVVRLRKQRKWRNMHSGGSKNADAASEREQRVAKMVVMISVLFVVCFCPSVIIFLAMVVEPGFTYNGKYHNMLILSYGFSNVFESTNSSMNIFIYYKMSTKYRTVFRQLCFSKYEKSNMCNMQQISK